MSEYVAAVNQFGANGMIKAGSPYPNPTPQQITKGLVKLADPEETQEVKPEETQEVKPEETQEVKPEETQEVKPEETQEVKPEETQEVKPEETKTSLVDDITNVLTRRRRKKS